MTPEDKDKILYEHALALKRIFIEKGTLGILLLILAGLGTLTIENYKLDKDKERFLLDKKLNTFKEINSEYAIAVSYYYEFSEKIYDAKKELQIDSTSNSTEVEHKLKKHITRKDAARFVKLLRNVQLSMMKNAIWVDREFQIKVGLVLNLLKSIGEQPLSVADQYRLFVADLSQYFVYMHKVEVGLSAPSPPFTPEPISQEELESSHIKNALDITYNKWCEAKECIK